MTRLLKLAAIVLTLCYPFFMYWGLQHYDVRVLFPILLMLLALRWVSGSGVGERKIVIATLVGLVVIVLVADYQLGLKFYPVLINAGFLALFATSLFSPTTIVERLARIKEPDLPVAAIGYTRKVTWLWSGFFLVNGLIAAATALWGSDEVWLIYNGMIAYLLIATLAVGEWLVRQRVRLRNEQGGNKGNANG